MELESEIKSLREKKATLVLKKREHELQLQTITNLFRVNGRMDQTQYRATCAAQTEHHRGILACEKQLLPIKNRLHELAQLTNHAPKEVAESQEFLASIPAKTDEAMAPVLVAELVAIREYYQNFAADGTRISSKRQMASEFVNKISPIIRRAVAATK